MVDGNQYQQPKSRGGSSHNRNSANLEQAMNALVSSTSSSSGKKTEDGSEMNLFPWVLHKLLDDSERQGNKKIVAWRPSGTMFKTYQRDQFVNKILPQYFRQTRYKSFVRQLNLWGFSCINQGSNRGCCKLRSKKKIKDFILKKKVPLAHDVILIDLFYGKDFHDKFIRGNSGLCREMSREKVKGGSTKKSLDTMPKSRKRVKENSAACGKQPSLTGREATELKSVATPPTVGMDSHEAEVAEGGDWFDKLEKMFSPSIGESTVNASGVEIHSQSFANSANMSFYSLEPRPIRANGIPLQRML